MLYWFGLLLSQPLLINLYHYALLLKFKICPLLFPRFVPQQSCREWKLEIDKRRTNPQNSNNLRGTSSWQNSETPRGESKILSPARHCCSLLSVVQLASLFVHILNICQCFVSTLQKNRFSTKWRVKGHIFGVRKHDHELRWYSGFECCDEIEIQLFLRFVVINMRLVIVRVGCRSQCPLK